jgi:hypothetical protein
LGMENMNLMNNKFLNYNHKIWSNCFSKAKLWLVMLFT